LTTPKRGETYFADIGELGRKLVLVVSADEINIRLRRPIVCLVTAKERERRLDTYVALDPPEGGIWKPSFILCHAILTTEEWRLDEGPLGELSTTKLQQVDAALGVALGLAA
jgi:mRNA-degrading endonuclease toxin of MazEF toxin-antitoxin module